MCHGSETFEFKTDIKFQIHVFYCTNATLNRDESEQDCQFGTMEIHAELLKKTMADIVPQLIQFS